MCLRFFFCSVGQNDLSCEVRENIINNKKSPQPTPGPCSTSTTTAPTKITTSYRSGAAAMVNALISGPGCLFFHVAVFVGAVVVVAS